MSQFHRPLPKLPSAAGKSAPGSKPPMPPPSFAPSAVQPTSADPLARGACGAGPMFGGLGGSGGGGGGASGMSKRQAMMQARDLEEQRKFGLAPLAVDSITGKEISPHLPQSVASAPWFYKVDGETLQHQRKMPLSSSLAAVESARASASSSAPSDAPSSTGNSGHLQRVLRSSGDMRAPTELNDKVTKVEIVGQASSYRAGACANCGAIGHTMKQCTERRKRVGSKFSSIVTGKDTITKDRYEMGLEGPGGTLRAGGSASTESGVASGGRGSTAFIPAELSYEEKRDRVAGIDVHDKVMAAFEAKAKAEGKTVKEIEEDAQAKRKALMAKQDSDALAFGVDDEAWGRDDPMGDPDYSSSDAVQCPTTAPPGPAPQESPSLTAPCTAAGDCGSSAHGPAFVSLSSDSSVSTSVENTGPTSAAAAVIPTAAAASTAVAVSGARSRDPDPPPAVAVARRSDLLRSADQGVALRSGGRSLRGEVSDLPKYLVNLDEASALYDPHTRSMRGNPLASGKGKGGGGVIAGYSAVASDKNLTSATNASTFRGDNERNYGGYFQEYNEQLLDLAATVKDGEAGTGPNARSMFLPTENSLRFRKKKREEVEQQEVKRRVLEAMYDGAPSAAGPSTRPMPPPPIKPE